MAKKVKSLKKVNKFGIGKFLVMALVLGGGLIYGTQMVQQNQDNRSDAAAKVKWKCWCTKSFYKNVWSCKKAGGTWKCIQTPSSDCTSYTYSDWGNCVKGFRTKVVNGASPKGCTPDANAATIVERCPKCTSYTYGDWSKCKNGTQVKMATGASPKGCDANLNSIFVSRECPKCTSYTYGALSKCDGGMQFKAVIGASPDGCEVDKNAAIVYQKCN